jgi:hypothetical protein
MKIKCIGCNEALHISEFYKHKAGVHGVLARCKKCVKLQRSKNYEYRIADPKFVQSERQRGREKYARLNYKEINREKMQDPARKLKHRIRTAAYSLLNKRVNSSTLLGCSHDEFFKYIESKFKKGMSWDNMNEWHLDHIVPLSWCSTNEELFIYSHYSNIQPLFAIDNLRKSDNYIG